MIKTDDSLVVNTRFHYYIYYIVIIILIYIKNQTDENTHSVWSMSIYLYLNL